MKKLFAFTLAEILITLGIIGVVAAMTIPNLMTKHFEKRTITKLKATYSILTNAIRMAEQEFGEADGWDYPNKNTWGSTRNSQVIVNNLRPFIKIATDCGNTDTNGACISKDCYNQFRGTCHGTYWNGASYKLKLLNGASIFIFGTNFDNDMIMEISIDVNGNSKPNTWGKDLFAFGYYRNRGLVPYGHPDFSSRSYKTNCGKNTTGFGCTYYVLNTNSMDYLKK